jgi:hypothetical protein
MLNHMTVNSTRKCVNVLLAFTYLLFNVTVGRVDYVNGR